MNLHSHLLLAIGQSSSGPVLVSLRLERQAACATEGASVTLAESASSFALALSSVPPGALTICALLVISHFASCATGIVTIIGISISSRCARSGLLLLHW